LGPSGPRFRQPAAKRRQTASRGRAVASSCCRSEPGAGTARATQVLLIGSLPRSLQQMCARIVATDGGGSRLWVPANRPENSPQPLVHPPPRELAICLFGRSPEQTWLR
jgi:hypothetical protein